MVTTQKHKLLMSPHLTHHPRSRITYWISQAYFISQHQLLQIIPTFYSLCARNAFKQDKNTDNRPIMSTLSFESMRLKEDDCPSPAKPQDWENDSDSDFDTETGGTYNKLILRSIIE